jgi:ubiquinone/menaquinone biosynthesis C-methylase UbiE
MSFSGKDWSHSVATGQDYFHTRFSYSKKRQIAWKQVALYLQRFIPPDAKVLDIGAGYLNFIGNIKAREKHALDVADLAGNDRPKDVFFHLGSVTEMKDVASSYFDCVFASNLIEHLDDHEREMAFFQIRRVLKDAGRLIILQPNFKYSFKVYFDDHTHRKAFTHIGLSHVLEENGFDVTKVLPRFVPFSVYSMLPAFGFLIWLYLRSPWKIFAGQMLIIAEKRR